MPAAVFIKYSNDKQYGLVREADMPIWLVRPNVVGFMGSDTFEEVSPETTQLLSFNAVTGTGTRLSLATKPDLDPRIPLRIATSYPRGANRLMKEAGYGDFEIVQILGGGVEGAIELPGEVNAIVDIAKSGDTLRDNGLICICQAMDEASLGLVWRNDTSDLTS